VYALSGSESNFRTVFVKHWFRQRWHFEPVGLEII
jgi:hypothetical protein